MEKIQLSDLEKRIYSYYESGTDIYIIAHIANITPQETLSIIKKISRYKRLNGMNKRANEPKEVYANKCEHCRWFPCDGSPVCYREKIDKMV